MEAPLQSAPDELLEFLSDSARLTGHEIAQSGLQGLAVRLDKLKRIVERAQAVLEAEQASPQPKRLTEVPADDAA